MDHNGLTIQRDPPDTLMAIRVASREEKREIVLRMIAAHPQGRLLLSAQPIATADPIQMPFESSPSRRAEEGSTQDAEPGNRRSSPRFEGAQLEGVNLQGIDLNEADLGMAILRKANLSHAHLDRADLAGADMAGADLRAAALGEANMQRTLLEDVNLERAGLRFTDLQGAVLDNANLACADLWGANLEGASCVHANLEGASLNDARLVRTDFQGASLAHAKLTMADLRLSNLRSVDLRGARAKGANWAGAQLIDANLQGVDLTDCDLRHVHLAGAWLEKTQFSPKQLGGVIGEELAGDFAGAGRGYFALERNFSGLGDTVASSWAYRRRRRMEKWSALDAAKAAWRKHRWLAATISLSQFSTDQVVEWLCDYGESVPRVLGSLALVYIMFIAIYRVSGGITHIVQTPNGPIDAPGRLLDLVVFSLMAMTNSGSSGAALPASVNLLVGVQALIGIALTGLLGFVVGNRIRR